MGGFSKLLIVRSEKQVTLMAVSSYNNWRASLFYPVSFLAVLKKWQIQESIIHNRCPRFRQAGYLHPSSIAISLYPVCEANQLKCRHYLPLEFSWHYEEYYVCKDIFQWQCKMIGILEHCNNVGGAKLQIELVGISYNILDDISKLYGIKTVQYRIADKSKQTCFRSVDTAMVLLSLGLRTFRPKAFVSLDPSVI